MRLCSLSEGVSKSSHSHLSFLADGAIVAVICHQHKWRNQSLAAGPVKLPVNGMAYLWAMQRGGASATRSTG